MTIIQSDRSDRSLEPDTDTDRPVKRVVICVPRYLSFINSPGASCISEQDALNLFSDRETIFKGSCIHFLALELIIFITAQCIRSAQIKQVSVRYVAVNITAHQTES